MSNIVRIHDFSHHHGKPTQGSTYIRVNQLIKYWNEADFYKYGENPEVLIFQKVYATPDYTFPWHFEGIKILDICDPDWLSGMMVKATVDVVDAIVTPTDSLANFIRQMTDKPIKVIPDRFDLEFVPEPKKHTQRANKIVWFGYSHNIETLRQATDLINELDLELIVIANDDPLFNRYVRKYKFMKYNEDTIYQDLSLADFAILPIGNRPVDIFKSNNKSVKANLAGLPVAIDSEGVRKYMEPEARQEFIDKQYDIIKSDYDVRKSVEQYKELIGEIKRSKSKS